MPTMTLCQTFNVLADQTWQTIEAAASSGMRWSEESNTEYLLLNLKLSHPAEISVHTFSRRQERSNGADWEWWFVGPHSAYGMRVQAKRISLPGATFKHLYYKTQMDDLIRQANAYSLTPAYCFYVHSHPGCLIGHAQQVKKTQSNRLSDLRPLLKPWSSLICPAPSPNTAGGIEQSDENGDIARRAAAAMRETVAHDSDFSFADVLNAPPLYVSELMAGSKAQASKRKIKGILMIRELGASRPAE